MGLISNTLKLFVKPVEVVKQAASPSKMGIKDRINAWVADLKRQREALKDIRRTNYDLGLTHYYKGNYSDARLRFNLLKWFKCDSPELNYFIGRCYYEEGKGDKAKKYLSDYLASSHTQFKPEAEFTMTIISGKSDEIKAIPHSLISHYYDLVSPVYNQMYIDKVQESPQSKLFTVLNKFSTEKGKPFGNKVLDLGCGTGVLGNWLRKIKLASTITGVDISKLMLDTSKSLKFEDFPVYNEVRQSDVLGYLGTLAQDVKFDIFIASNLFAAETQIEQVLDQAFGHAEEKAIFAMSVKLHDNPADYRFYSDVEEFIFNKDFILKVVAKKWNILHQEEVTFVDGDVGMVIILQKS